MTYQPLTNYYIKFQKKQSVDFDANTGVVLVPPKNMKLYVQRFNSNGLMTASHEIIYATRISGAVKLVNASPCEVDLHVIQL